MSAEEAFTDDLMVLEEEAMKVSEQVQAYHRKLMAPIWEKRREMVKKIPNFWNQVFTNSTLSEMDPTDNDIEAIENLVDFHVEYDDNKPDYRKVTATFKKNNVFKNETLVKEFTIDPESDATVISKSTIDYHENKAPNQKKRKANDDDDDFDGMEFLDWFSNDDARMGILLTEDIFPNALDYYQGDESDEDIDEEIELGSDSEGNRVVNSSLDFYN
ncbi:hypothetical protein BDF20DRAFT_88533 [Mycotypha africana]|uniref:uncharacterized protein n=1 Tax=Mycotypha africana TaxID=64632 RepID=UPI002301FB5B|nr:uncharacterized protein BDF20DRAFT_88533 [Mycotypha africana]KAI8992125.1 hypothetical protein BDF20DRAFT_88533 [Mycotypha africana]